MSEQQLEQMRLQCEAMSKALVNANKTIVDKSAVIAKYREQARKINISVGMILEDKA